MANIFQGTVAPDVNTTRATATEAPQYFTDYLTSIAGAGQQALDRPNDQLVAPLTAMQTQGYAAVPGAATSYQPGLAAATQTAGQAAQGITPQNVQNLMNPYTQNVVGEMERLSQQNMQRNIMPAMKAGFVGTGGLGGQRYASAIGQSMSDTQRDLTGQQYGALSKGYSEALQAALQNAQLQNQVAQTQGNLAKSEQELGLTGAGAMTKAGAEMQTYDQAKIDAPLKQATNTAALLRGYQVPTSVTEKFTGPMAGVYGSSPLAQISGLGAMVGSGMSGTTGPNGQTTPGWMTTLGNQIGNLFTSSNGVPNPSAAGNPLQVGEYSDPGYWT